MELFTYFHQSYALRFMSYSVFLFSLNMLKPVRIEFQHCMILLQNLVQTGTTICPCYLQCGIISLTDILGQPLRIRFLT